MTRRLLALLVLVALVAGCSGSPADGGAGGDLSGDLLVFAAASLTEPFEALTDALEDAHPDLEVTVSLAGSQQLAGQIVEGAPADVFASAAEAQMGVVVDAGLADGTPETFATNLLEIAVEPGNPLGITGLADLADDDLVLVLVTEDAPAGRYAAEALAAAGIEAAPDSLELDVRAALSKVVLGEADAAIVYRTDVVAAGEDVEGIVIPDEENVIATYPIAVLAEAPNPAAARAFVDLVTSERGQDLLVEAGFERP